MILLMILFIIILTFFFITCQYCRCGFVGSSVGPQCTIQMTGLVFPRAFHNFSNFSLFIGLGMVPGCHLVSMEFNNLFTKMAPSSVNQILEGIKPGKYIRLDQLFYSLTSFVLMGIASIHLDIYSIANKIYWNTWDMGKCPNLFLNSKKFLRLKWGGKASYISQREHLLFGIYNRFCKKKFLEQVGLVKSRVQDFKCTFFQLRSGHHKLLCDTLRIHFMMF